MFGFKKEKIIARVVLCAVILALTVALAACGPKGESADDGSSSSASNGGAAGAAGAADDGVFRVGLYAQSPQGEEPGFLICASAEELTPGLAGKYGFEYDPAIDPVTDITALDAAVAAHILVYGDKKTEVTDNLAVTSGFITEAFGFMSYSWMTTVNGESPNDGNYTEEWGYTGLASNQAVLESGDVVYFYCPKLSDFEREISDDTAWFEQDGAQVASVSANAGEATDLTLTGYPLVFMFREDADRNIGPLSDARIVALEVDDPTATFGSELGVTAADGAFSLVFDKPGTYYVTAVYGDENEKALMAPVLEVVVE